jgi:hypothetical protein
MIVGALVLVEVTAGITEASMTRNPSSPCTRDSSSTTPIGCEPIAYLGRGGDDRRAVGQNTLAGDQPPPNLAGERQAAQGFVGGLHTDAKSQMVLHENRDFLADPDRARLAKLGVDGRDLRFGERLGAVHDPVGV